MLDLSTAASTRPRRGIRRRPRLVGQMISFQEQRDADFTVAGGRVSVEQNFSFGILQTSPTDALLGFQVKPERVTPMSAAPARVYASIGNYLFRPGTLIEFLESAIRRGSTDFGRYILPRASRAYVSDFHINTVAGIKPYDERDYWRDIGTLGAYESAQQDLLGVFPRHDFANSEWPIQAGTPWPVRRTPVWQIQAFDATVPGEYGAGPAP